MISKWQLRGGCKNRTRTQAGKLHPPAMTNSSFSFKDMSCHLQSKRLRTPDQWYCCFVVSLRSDFTRSCLLHDWDSKQNISEQLGKALLVSTSGESHAKGLCASLGERCDALQECQIKVKYPACQGYQRSKIFTSVHHNQCLIQSMKGREKICVDFVSDRAEFVL